MDAAALELRLDGARCEGRALAIDVRSEAWLGVREIEARDQARAYAARSASQAVLGWTMLAPLDPSDPRCHGS
jgi:hypothetical protein